MMQSLKLAYDAVITKYKVVNSSNRIDGCESFLNDKLLLIIGSHMNGIFHSSFPSEH